jgi:hypothetical protein
MNKEQKRLISKICMFEDMLLRSKNQYEIDAIYCELIKMRKKLQRMQYEANRGVC